MTEEPLFCHFLSEPHIHPSGQFLRRVAFKCQIIRVVLQERLRGFGLFQFEQLDTSKPLLVGAGHDPYGLTRRNEGSSAHVVQGGRPRPDAPLLAKASCSPAQGDPPRGPDSTKRSIGPGGTKPRQRTSRTLVYPKPNAATHPLSSGAGRVSRRRRGLQPARVPYGWVADHPDLCRGDGAGGPAVGMEPPSLSPRSRGMSPDNVGLSRYPSHRKRRSAVSQAARHGRARVLGGCDTMKRIEELLTRSRP